MAGLFVGLAAVAGWVALKPSVARAQVRIPSAMVADEEQVSRVLQKGQQLERERRWGEALSHYEDAVKSHPERRDFHDRLTLSKAHFDVTRRYADRSFTHTVDKLRAADALELYSEVLTKIHTHYVQPPNWHDLVRRGTFMLEVALTEPLFLEKHLAGVSAAKINRCRDTLRDMTDKREIQNRHEARDSVVAASQFAVSELGLPAEAVVLEYMCGATSSLDEYSSFLTGDQLDDVFSQIEGNFVGLGIELKAENQALLIVNVIASSPADKGGLRRGERIVAVDGQTTTDISTDAAADLLKGLEGSTVTVEVHDAQGAARSVRMLRERVEVPSVEDVKIADASYGIGYLKLSSFQKTTSRDVDAALWKLHKLGMKSLIVDVRGNPGGLLTAAVEVADKFVPQGIIVSTKGRNTSEDFEYKAHSVGTWRVPLVVLIDGDSASASEIFAGAIRDHRRGQIVGQNSYGKGSVQGIFPLTTTNAGVRLTTAKFYSPNGQAISKVGVAPDIRVPLDPKPHLVAKPAGETIAATPPPADTVLNEGLKHARHQLSQRQP